jgi:hypothetical protein
MLLSASAETCGIDLSLVMADSIAAKRNKLDGKKVTLAQRALTVPFGEKPSGAERLAFGVLFFIPECLPDLADLTDEQLRGALHTTILRMLRTPSRSSKELTPEKMR